MRVGIVGLGQVGETLQYGFRRIGHEIFAHDVRLGTRIGDVLGTQICFVCVPTESRPDGECDVSVVEDVCSQLHALVYQGLVVIKSTVTPGTTERLSRELSGLQLAFCPEFLRERSRYSDFVENHDVCIVGADSYMKFDIVRAAHRSIPKEFAHVTPTEAELCKYFANCFNALRITFANEMHDVCEAAGADYQSVKSAIVKRKSIGDSYLDSSKQFRAFGGRCLPKDTEALSKFAQRIGVETTLLNTVIRENKRNLKIERWGRKPDAAA